MMRTAPALAIIGYVISALIGLYLVVSVLIQDRRDQERAKNKAK
jgi:hypothetical protein